MLPRFWSATLYVPVSPARMNRGPPTPIVTSGCDRLLDLEAIRRDGHLAVGVGDLHVVQADAAHPSGRTRR